MSSNIWARRAAGRSRSRRRIAVSVAVWTGIVVGILALIVGWVAFVTWLLMTAWNYVMAPVFGWPELTFWQAFAVSFIVNLLASGFRASIHVKQP